MKSRTNPADQLREITFSTENGVKSYAAVHACHTILPTTADEEAILQLKKELDHEILIYHMTNYSNTISKLTIENILKKSINVT